jgi:hypothetical protein
VRTPLPDLYPAIALERSQYLGGFRHVSRVTIREARDSCPSHATGPHVHLEDNFGLALGYEIRSPVAAVGRGD